MLTLNIVKLLMKPHKSYFIFFLVFFLSLSLNLKPVSGVNIEQTKASKYRALGFEAQERKEYSQALKLYLKAIEENPFYSVAYNDCGIVYEMLNRPDLAKQMYQKAIELDPGYLASYSNLALLFEKQREYEKAGRMWARRVELGESEDKWTMFAQSRLLELSKIDSDVKKMHEELQTLELINEVKGLKGRVKESDSLAAEVYFENGKKFYERGEYLKALQQLHRALNLDPRNKEIGELFLLAQKRAFLSN